MLIDTHAHLDFPEFDEDREQVIARAVEAGVERIITIGTRLETSRNAVALAEKYPQVYATVGVHPTSVPEETDDFLPALRELAAHPRVVAIGEIGLDYYRLPSRELLPKRAQALHALGSDVTEDSEAAIADGAYKAAQQEAFYAQLQLAQELGLNVVIHQRESFEDCWNILSDFHGQLSGVFHCFGGDAETARQILGAGHRVSFTGIVTFKNAEPVRETVASLPDGAFMVETDCPFLAPVPNRGKRCEPADTRLTAERIAELRGVALDAIARETTEAAESFFQFNR